MTTPIPATLFADPASAERLERAAAALTAHGFTVEILDDAAAARTRVKDLIPEGASVFTGASETLRLSGIDTDINTSGRYDAVKSRGLAMDRVRDLAKIWRMMSTPDVIVGSVHAVTETGSLWSPRPAEASYPATRRRRPRDLDSRGAEGGTRPERRAAPRRRPLPPAGKRPRSGGLRGAQRHQPPSHPQRRTPPRARHRPAAPRSHRILKPPGVVRWPVTIHNVSSAHPAPSVSGRWGAKCPSGPGGRCCPGRSVLHRAVRRARLASE